MKQFIVFLATILILSMCIGVLELLAVPLPSFSISLVSIRVENNKQYLYDCLNFVSRGDEAMTAALINDSHSFLGDNISQPLTLDLENIWNADALIGRAI